MYRCLLGLIACYTLVASFAASAQPFPARFVTLIINSEPGGAQDRIANALKDDIAAALGQQIVLDYRIGAGGITALGAFKRAKPDGYTILLTGSGPMTIAPLLYSVPYDPIKDFDYVHRVLDLPGVVAARASLPVSTIQEFIALARQSPGKYTFASTGIASPSHLLGERLKLLTGIDILHVPFKGPPAAVTSLLSGDLDVFMSSAPLVVPHASAGKLRLLVIVGSKRLKVAPDVPTVGESGLAALTLPSWFGFLAPKGTPRARSWTPLIVPSARPRPARKQRKALTRLAPTSSPCRVKSLPRFMKSMSRSGGESSSRRVLRLSD